MRTFIAVNLPFQAKKELASLQKDLERKHWPVRWENPEKIHITLAFLGSLPKPHVSKLQTVIKKACSEIKSFEISFKGLGAFPNFVQPRIVWLGLKGDLKSLAFLQKQIGRELEKAGIWFDKKPFVPHVTIGRVKTGISQGALRDLGKKNKQMRQIALHNRILVESVEIMKSDLFSEGSVYTVLDKISFYGV
jgi:2'-5' RNA ligase